jgi:uncharacterized protein YjbI with pentapeptide repeats
MLFVVMTLVAWIGVDFLLSLAGVPFLFDLWEVNSVTDSASKGQIVAAATAWAGGSLGLWTFFVNVWEKRRAHEQQLQKDREIAELQRLEEPSNQLLHDFSQGGPTSLLARVNAAIGLADLAVRPHPGLSEDELAAKADIQPEGAYPFFCRAATQLSAALYLYAEPEARARVRKAIRAMAEFTARTRGAHRLWLFLLEQLADANRQAYETAIQAIDNWVPRANERGDLSPRIKALDDKARALAIRLSPPTRYGHAHLRLLTLLSEATRLRARQAETDPDIERRKEELRGTDTDPEATSRLGRALGALEETCQGIAECVRVLGAHGAGEARTPGFERGPNLARCWLVQANLQGANLQKANLQDANLQVANLQGAQLQEANLQGANLQEANLQAAHLDSANLQEANLQKANLQHARLDDAKLQDANLQEAKLEHARLQHANLQNAKLQDANLASVDFTGANLTNAKAKAANLRDAHLPVAVLNAAELRQATMKSCCLSGARLWAADLAHADLSMAQLAYADFRGADLSDATILDAWWDDAEVRIANFTGVQLAHIASDSCDRGVPKDWHQVSLVIPDAHQEPDQEREAEQTWQQMLRLWLPVGETPPPRPDMAYHDWRDARSRFVNDLYKSAQGIRSLERQSHRDLEPNPDPGPP